MQSLGFKPRKKITQSWNHYKRELMYVDSATVVL